MSLPSSSKFREFNLLGTRMKNGGLSVKCCYFYPLEYLVSPLGWWSKTYTARVKYDLVWWFPLQGHTTTSGNVKPTLWGVVGSTIEFMTKLEWSGPRTLNIKRSFRLFICSWRVWVLQTSSKWEGKRRQVFYDVCSINCYNNCLYSANNLTHVFKQVLAFASARMLILTSPIWQSSMATFSVLCSGIVWLWW